MPEITLAPQTANKFSNVFGDQIAVWHSKLSPSHRSYYWKNICSGNFKIVIGARSALLLPFKNLGIIIVDEEHDSSYKQDEGVIYNARDMAIARANFEKNPIHLVTSVPSIETFNNIHNKKYSYSSK